MLQDHEVNGAYTAMLDDAVETGLRADRRAARPPAGDPDRART
jgi:hypothetical protein